MIDELLLVDVVVAERGAGGEEGFGEARCDPKAEQVQIRVTITGKDSVVVKFVYVMLKEDGQYKVVSVFGGAPTKSEPRDVA